MLIEALVLAAIPARMFAVFWLLSTNPGQRFSGSQVASETTVGYSMPSASCQTTAVTVKGAPVTTAPAPCATAT